METIEGYDILEKIGEGGMGQVFKAVHRRLDRPVAIKRLAPHLSNNQDMMRRFLQEARLQARLSHPNVVNIFDLIENEQGIFLVMEYVEGLTVREMLIARGRIDAPEALMIAEGVLSGLAFMHKNGVVHRDIKPSNIMASAAGDIKVTDFGIARLVNEETGLTRFGGGIGTLHYMAPELIKSGEVSFSIDIYSLGATLHEMLSGAPPFTGNTDLEIMMGHMEKAPPELVLPCDDEACALCRDAVFRALAKTPDQRFPSAEAFLADVRRIRQLMATSPSLQGAAFPHPVVNPAPRTPTPDQERPTAFTPVPPGEATSAVPIIAPGADGSAPADPAVAVAGKATSAAPLADAPAKARQDKTAPAKTASAPTSPAAPAAKTKRPLYLAAAAALLAAAVLIFFLRPGKETPPARTPASVETTAAPATPSPAGSADSTQAVPTAQTQAAPAAQAQAVPTAQTQAVPTAQTQAVPTAQTQAAPADSAPAASATTTPVAPSAPDKAAAEPSTRAAAPLAQAPGPQAEPGAAQEPTPARNAGELAAKETAASAPAAPPAAPPEAKREEATQPAASTEAPAPADQGPAPGQDAAAPDASAAASTDSRGRTPQEPAPASPAQQRIVYVKTQDARIRAEADAESDILATLDIGTRLVALGADGDWLKAQTPDGRTGFIMARLTSDEPPAPPAPAQAPARTAKPSPRKPKQPTGADQGWKIVK